MVNLNIIKNTWEKRVWKEFKKILTRTPVTKTTSNLSGSETLTDGAADTNYQGILFRRQDTYNQEYVGLFKGADAILLVKTSQTINKNDKIAFDGDTFRVDDVVNRYAGTLKIYQTARLFLIT